LLLRTGGRSRALVVVPAALRLNWERELERWAPDLSVRVVRGDDDERRALYLLPFNVLVASYEQVRSDASTIAGDVGFDIVALDEAQRIKNADSATALSCRLLRRDHSWALTGTPIQNAVTDLVSVFRFVQPGLIRLGMSVPEIHAAMQPHYLRRLKTDVLPELPPITVQEIPLELTESQKAAYDRVWLDRNAIVAAADHRSAGANMLGLITKLKQICNFEAASGESSKMEALRLIIDGLTGPDDKLIVFSQYVGTLRWISEQLHDGPPRDLYHGGLRGDVRDQVVDRFMNEPGPRVLLMSIMAGGVGLNLQAASTVVMFDRWWNPAVEEQAIHRAHRFGRERPLHVYRFLVGDSVEDRIAAVLEDKKILFERYVESAKSAPTSVLSRSDLARILDLHLPGLAG
jgi:SNF2 family DNA or RNA helicase